jgi:hypothetical protein
MRDQHSYIYICTTAKNWLFQRSRFCGAYACLMHTCFLCNIQRKQQPQGRQAPVGRADGAPLLFSLYITQETSMHQTWACTTKSAALEGPIFGAGVYIYVGRPLVTTWALRPGFMSARTPHDFESNRVHIHPIWMG